MRKKTANSNVAVFFVPRDSRSVGTSYRLTPRNFIILSPKPWATLPNLYKILIVCEYLNYLVDAHYDTVSLSAISQMGIGPGKGVFTTVKQANIKACVHRLITGGERWSGKQQGPHNETLFMYRVHCRQRTRCKER